MVTHQLQVERRTAKERWPETYVLPLSHADQPATQTCVYIDIFLLQDNRRTAVFGHWCMCQILSNKWCHSVTTKQSVKILVKPTLVFHTLLITGNFHVSKLSLRLRIGLLRYTVSNGDYAFIHSIKIKICP